MKINIERQHFLEQEQKEYEKTIPMTESERLALREWVSSGMSVHENGSMACYEGGYPVDFLDVYREEEKIRTVLASMSYEAGSQYLLKEYGIDRDSHEELELTYEELRKKAQEQYKVTMLYSMFLFSHGLLEEADDYVRAHMEDEFPFDPFKRNDE